MADPPKLFTAFSQTEDKQTSSPFDNLSSATTAFDNLSQPVQLTQNLPPSQIQIAQPLPPENVPPVAVSKFDSNFEPSSASEPRTHPKPSSPKTEPKATKITNTTLQPPTQFPPQKQVSQTTANLFTSTMSNTSSLFDNLNSAPLPTSFDNLTPISNSSTLTNPITLSTELNSPEPVLPISIDVTGNSLQTGFSLETFSVDQASAPIQVQTTSAPYQPSDAAPQPPQPKPLIKKFWHIADQNLFKKIDKLSNLHQTGIIIPSELLVNLRNKTLNSTSHDDLRNLCLKKLNHQGDRSSVLNISDFTESEQSNLQLALKQLIKSNNLNAALKLTEILLNNYNSQTSYQVGEFQEFINLCQTRVSLLVKMSKFKQAEDEIRNFYNFEVYCFYFIDDLEPNLALKSKNLSKSEKSENSGHDKELNSVTESSRVSSPNFDAKSFERDGSRDSGDDSIGVGNLVNTFIPFSFRLLAVEIFLHLKNYPVCRNLLSKLNATLIKMLRTENLSEKLQKTLKNYQLNLDKTHNRVIMKLENYDLVKSVTSDSNSCQTQAFQKLSIVEKFKIGFRLSDDEIMNLDPLDKGIYFMLAKNYKAAEDEFINLLGNEKFNQAVVMNNIALSLAYQGNLERAIKERGFEGIEVF